jgi:archaetidylinositol phosphate synthase
MTVSTEDPCAAPTVREPRRAGRELLLEVVFRPGARLFVPALRRVRVPPPVVVLANAGIGLVAALALARGELIAAAVLLQAKTLLDNMDGELARATGRVTLLGRYLDTLADLLVNAALFVALGSVTGQWPLAIAAFLALTVVLAADFNVTELHREANGIASVRPRLTDSRLERVLAAAYSAMLGPLDRALRALAARRFPRGTSYDAVTVTVLANMGLTTQLVALGVCLVVGGPSAYLWLCLGCLCALVPLQLWAERRAHARAAGAAP